MTDAILVINAGSSSVKVSLFGPGPSRILSAHVEEIGTRPRTAGRGADGRKLFADDWPNGGGPADHAAAVAYLVGKLPDSRVGAVGHRVVHGGSEHTRPVVVDAEVRAGLERLVPLAPLHAPANLKGIDAASAAFPGVPQVACFDTAFHQGHPWVADTFALPNEYYDTGVRRYGFHGISYEYIARRVRELAPALAAGRMAVAHLGNGASVCAIRDGKSVDSTMSFTALDGLPMGTRCGQIDPAVLLFLMSEKKMSVDQLTELLYKRSGLLGLSGVSSDMRELLASDQPAAKRAVDYFVYRVTGAFAAMAAAMGGLDGVVFTAGIGEHAAAVRERVCRGLAWLGVELDETANAAGGPCFSKPGSKVSAWVVPTDEERMIAIHVTELLGGPSRQVRE